MEAARLEMARKEAERKVIAQKEAARLEAAQLAAERVEAEQEATRRQAAIHLQAAQRGKMARTPSSPRNSPSTKAAAGTEGAATGDALPAAVGAVVAVGVAVPTLQECPKQSSVLTMDLPSDGTVIDEYALAAVKLQAAQRGRRTRSTRQLPRTPQLSRRASNDLMATGHRAYKDGDFAAARLNFLVAYEQGEGRLEAAISAANMAVRLGDLGTAEEEYSQLLLRDDLSPYLAQIVAAKLQQVHTSKSPTPNILAECLTGGTKCLAVRGVPDESGASHKAVEGRALPAVDATVREATSADATSAEARPKRAAPPPSSVLAAAPAKAPVSVVLPLLLLTLAALLLVAAAALCPEEVEPMLGLRHGSLHVEPLLGIRRGALQLQWPATWITSVPPSPSESSWMSSAAKSARTVARLVYSAF